MELKKDQYKTIIKYKVRLYLKIKETKTNTKKASYRQGKIKKYRRIKKQKKIIILLKCIQSVDKCIQNII